MVNTVIPTTVRLAELAQEVASIPLVRIPDDSGHGHFGGPTGWIHGLANKRIQYEDYPSIWDAIDEFRTAEGLHEPVQVLVNKLGPGAYLAQHRDGLPDHLRFHLPIVTNTDAYWWDEYGGKIHMTSGWWYGPVPYCGILHSAGNPGPSDRIHLVADFKKGN